MCVNVMPIVSGASRDQAVNDNETIKPFLGVNLADYENDNISITISLDDNAKGTLSTKIISRGTIASVQATLRDIIFTPTANREAVGDSETTTFTITANDGTADSTPNTGTSVVSTSVDDAPTASSVTFSGTLKKAETVTGSYTYADADLDTEGTSTYKWYRSDDVSATNKVAITGATAKTYVLASADVGKFMSFEVTPVNAIGTGLAVQSAINATAVKQNEISVNTGSSSGESTTVAFDENLNTTIEQGANSTTATMEVGDKEIILEVQNGGGSSGGMNFTDENGEPVKLSMNITLGNAETTVDASGNIKTTVKADNGASIETNLNADGSTSAVIEVNGVSTEVKSVLKDTSIDVDENGTIVVISQVEKNGIIYKTIITTDSDGNTTAELIKIDPATGKELESTSALGENSTFEPGAKTEVVEIDGVIVIKVSTPLNGTLVIG